MVAAGFVWVQLVLVSSLNPNYSKLETSVYVLLDQSIEGPVHPTTAFSLSTRHSNTSVVASGQYLESVNLVGQGRLIVNTVSNPGASDQDYFYALGLAEGYLSAERVVQQLYNVVWSKPRQNQYIYQFLAAQYNYMRTNAEERGRHDSYWLQVGLSLARLDGIMDGIKARQAGSDTAPADWLSYPVTYMALYELNAISELGEIAGSVGNATSINTGRFTSSDEPAAGLADWESDFRFAEFEMAEQTKCSALVKLVNLEDPNSVDLLVSHNTWTSYGEMLRIYKTLSFPDVAHPSFVNKRFSMASYPGYLSSTDDWVTLPDSKILITETTNECIDRKRLREFVQPDSVTTVVRSIVASVMAGSGSEWSDVFSLENSGTYNNQWILVDFAKFEKWKSDPSLPPSDVLWIVEQAPGLVIGKDMTDHLFEETFWASYNRPYFAQIADVSGYTVASKKRGEWFHHQKCPRARMFDAVQSSVVDVDSLRSIMTLNMYDVMNATYLHTHGCPKNQIAGRYDIDAQLSGEDFKKCGPVMAYGALDCKITTSQLIANNTVLMVSAPLWNNTVPAFSWSELPMEAQTSHWGQPDKWDFPFFAWTDERLTPSEPLANPPKLGLPRYVIGKPVRSLLPELTLLQGDL